MKTKIIVIKLALLVVTLTGQIKGLSQNVSNQIPSNAPGKSSDYILRLIVNPVTGELIIKADLKFSSF